VLRATYRNAQGGGAARARRPEMLLKINRIAGFGRERATMRKVERSFAGCAFAAGIAAAVLSVGGARAQLIVEDNARASALASAYNASGEQLFANLAGSPGNIVISPYSVGTAMAMALAGARGETAAEMAKVLMHDMTGAEIDAANAEVLAILAGYDHSGDPWTCPVGATVQDHQCEAQPLGDKRLCRHDMRLEGDRCVGKAIPPPFAKIATANALVLSRRGVLISDRYAGLLRTNYAADVFASTGIAEINGWVAHKTEGKIDRILERLDSNTAAVLLNAVYFKARWETVFDQKDTRKEAFSLTRSQSVEVPLMNLTGDFALVARTGYQAIRLPYAAATLGMVVVLPDEVEGLGEVVRELDATEMTELFAALRDPQTRKTAALSLPRFRAAYTANLIGPFQQAGIKMAFDSEKADFSGMTDQPPLPGSLYIDQIVHRAVIEVAEESTEAAAATAVTITARSLAKPVKPETFRVDRPFLFCVVDEATGAVLFQGRITDPR
jgi:serpin B